MIARYKIIFYFIVFSLLLFSSGPAVAACRLIYPPAKSVLNVDQFLIIGLCKDSSRAVGKITNKSGTQQFTAQVNNKAFSQQLKLAPGLNTISLVDSTPPMTINVFYKTKGVASPPDGFRPYFLHLDLSLNGKCGSCHVADPQNQGDYTHMNEKFSCLNQKCHADMGHKKFQHGPFKKKQCLQCHNPHGTVNKHFLRAAKSALCFSCHAEDRNMLKGAKYIHFPVARGECTSCHAPHESDIEFHLKGRSISALCYRCHDKNMFKYKYVHAPVQDGNCSACHTPHVSKYKGLLSARGEALCVTCHEVRKDEFKRRHVHKPVKQDCGICHDPHASPVEYQLRTKKDKNGRYIKIKHPIQKLCLACHTRLNPKIAKAIISAPVPHRPVKEGKCVICHTPHSTNFQKQLRARAIDLCFSCHKKIARKIKGSLYKHGPVRQGECYQCHEVHGSKNKFLLRAPFSTKFKGPFNLDKFQLCFNCHNKKVFTDPHSMETSFRNGTTNLHFLHVNNQKNSRYCKSCHDIHASDQEKHIRTSFTFNRHVKVRIKFTKTDRGGRCVTGCHKPEKYRR